MLPRLERAKRATSEIERPSASQSRACMRRKGRAPRTRVRAFRSRCRSPELKPACMRHARRPDRSVQKLFRGYLDHFQPDEFPRMLEHLAESEWRTGNERYGEESVVEPIWHWLIEQFDR